MECAICLEEITEKEKAVLNCDHIYHQNCIRKNLNYNSSCPYCRKSIKEIIFKESKDDSLEHYIDLDSDLDITFNGYRIIETNCLEGKVAIPLFLEEGKLKTPVEISKFKDVTNYIEINNFYILISWIGEVIILFKDSYGCSVSSKDYKFMISLLYLTLKEYPKVRERYQLIATAVLYQYFKIIKIIQNLDNLTLKLIKENMLYVSLNQYTEKSLENILNFQDKILKN